MGVSIGAKIKALRKTHNLTQQQFGDIFHYSRTAISNFEHNKRQLSLELLRDIADHFQINIMYFFDDDCPQTGNKVLTFINNKTPLDITILTPAQQIKIVQFYFELIEQAKKQQKASDERAAG